MNKKGFAPTLLLLVIGILVVAGGVYYFSKKLFVPVSEFAGGIPPLSAVETSSPPQPIVSTSSTASSKTYANAQYGFSFQYPTSYTTIDGRPNSNTVGVWFVWVSNQNQKTLVAINVFESNLTLDAFVSNERSQLSGVAESSVKAGQPTTTSGESAQEIIQSYSGKNNGVSNIFYIKKGTIIFRIQLNLGVDNATADTILRSFLVN